MFEMNFAQNQNGWGDATLRARPSPRPIQAEKTTGLTKRHYFICCVTSA